MRQGDLRGWFLVFGLWRGDWSLVFEGSIDLQRKTLVFREKIECLSFYELIFDLQEESDAASPLMAALPDLLRLLLALGRLAGRPPTQEEARAHRDYVSLIFGG